MKPLINLASEPFRNRRLFWLSLLLLFVVSTLAGVRMLRLLTELDVQLADRAPSVVALEARAREMEKTTAEVQTLTPEQTRAYWAANDLIARKAFSWTQLLNDIERRIPPGVRVLRVGINKAAASEGAREGSTRAIKLMMDVIGKSVEDVTLMIDDFNRSGIFLVTPKLQKQVEGTTEIEFSLELDYLPPGAAGAASGGTQIAERKQE